MESKVQGSPLLRNLFCSPNTPPRWCRALLLGSHKILGMYVPMAVSATLYFNVSCQFSGKHLKSLSVNSCHLMTPGLKCRDGESS